MREKVFFNACGGRHYVGPLGASGVSSFPFLHHKFFIWFLNPFLVAETYGKAVSTLVEYT